VCGHSISHSQTVTVNDNIQPLQNALATTFECAPDTPALLCGSDNCPGIDIQYSEAITNRVCAYSYDITRSWALTDSCGNRATTSQLVHVRDTTALVALNHTTPCSLPEILAPTATTHCGDNATITNDVGTCPRSVQYSWRAVDTCGNYAWLIINTQTPSISFTAAAPLNQTVTCGLITPFPQVLAAGECNPTLTRIPDVTAPGSCPYIFNVTRAVSAQDTCNLHSQYAQFIQSVHVLPPTLSARPADMAVNCTTVVPVDTVTTTDSCGASVPVPTSSSPAAAPVFTPGSAPEPLLTSAV
jgi:hypothetical protein